MTELTVTIPVQTNASLISTSLPSGALIVNKDTQNSVWISSQAGASAGFGVEIGPRGSARWNPEAPCACYGVVETGATSSVTLSVSTLVSDVTDPLGTGVAIASELYDTGIRSVFRNDVLGVWNTFFGNAIPAGGSVAVDVFQYATLTLQVNANPPGKVSLFMEVHAAPIGGAFDAIITSETFSVADTAVSGTFAVPVIGQSVVFTNKSAGPIQLALYGNNRLLGTSQPINVGGQNVPRQFQSAFVNTPASGLVTPLTSNDSGPGSTNFNGEVSLRMFVSVGAGGAKPSFLVQMAYYDPVASRSLSIAHAAQFTLAEGVTAFWDYYTTIHHPVGVVTWQTRMSTASAATNVRWGLEIIPSSS